MADKYYSFLETTRDTWGRVLCRYSGRGSDKLNTTSVLNQKYLSAFFLNVRDTEAAAADDNIFFKMESPVNPVRFYFKCRLNCNIVHSDSLLAARSLVNTFNVDCVIKNWQFNDESFGKAIYDEMSSFCIDNDGFLLPGAAYFQDGNFVFPKVKFNDGDIKTFLEKSYGNLFVPSTITGAANTQQFDVVELGTVFDMTVNWQLSFTITVFE